MEKIVPVLPIDSEEAAVKFYVDGLGFEIDFAWRHEPEFPVHMGVKHGELYLHLSEHARGQAGAELYLFIDDIETWSKRCNANGVTIADGPTKMPWGNTDMVISDPFGSTLRFSQLNTHEPTATSA